MDKLNLGQLGEKLKTGGAQMSRMVSLKVKEVKEMLQAPTPESRMVDEATVETLEEPNWGINLRICAMINNNVFNGSEVVKAIKRKVSQKSPVAQRLSLDLLEACAMNCDKVFSAIASEKVLEDLVVRLVNNPEADPHNRRRAFQLIRAWGESDELAYLPVFRQTYMSLKDRDEPQDIGGGSSPYVPNSLESYMDQQPLDPHGSYPIPEAGVHALDDSAFFSGHQHISPEEKKEFIVVARNSLELLSSILSSEAEPKPLKEDLTVSLLDKCKQSLPVIKGIVETTIDEVTLFEALNLNDELQQVVSKYEELEAAQNSGAEQQPQNAETAKHDAEADQNPNELHERLEGDDESEDSEAAQKLKRKSPTKSNTLEANATAGYGGHVETKTVDNSKEKTESSHKINTD